MAGATQAGQEASSPLFLRQHSEPHSPDSSLPASLFCFCPSLPPPREAAAGTRSSSCNTEFGVHFWEPLKWLYAENQCMKFCPWVAESPQFLSKPWSKEEIVFSLSFLRYPGGRQQSWAPTDVMEIESKALGLFRNVAECNNSYVIQKTGKWCNWFVMLLEKLNRKWQVILLYCLGHWSHIWYRCAIVGYVLFLSHLRRGKQGHLPVSLTFYKALLANSGTPT